MQILITSDTRCLGGTGDNARVEVRAPATARYTIIATSLLSEETGSGFGESSSEAADFRRVS